MPGVPGLRMGVAVNALREIRRETTVGGTRPGDPEVTEPGVPVVLSGILGGGGVPTY